jgi:hypothetical protein
VGKEGGKLKKQIKKDGASQGKEGKKTRKIEKNEGLKQ